MGEMISLRLPPANAFRVVSPIRQLLAPPNGGAEPYARGSLGGMNLATSASAITPSPVQSATGWSFRAP